MNVLIRAFPVVLIPLLFTSTIDAGHNRLDVEKKKGLAKRFGNHIVFGGQYVGKQSLPVALSANDAGTVVDNDWMNRHCESVGIDVGEFLKQTGYDSASDQLRAGVISFRVWTGTTRTKTTPSYDVSVPWVAVQTKRPPLKRQPSSVSYHITCPAAGASENRYLVALAPFGRPAMLPLKAPRQPKADVAVWYRWRLLKLRDGSMLLENADAPPDQPRYLSADCAARRKPESRNWNPENLNVYLARDARGRYRQSRWKLNRRKDGTVTFQNLAAAPRDPSFLDTHCPTSVLYTSPSTNAPYTATRWKLTRVK